MDITPLLAKTKLNIFKYGEGNFETNQGVFNSSIIAMPSKAMAAEFTNLDAIDKSIFENNPIVIIGTGKTQIFDNDLRNYFLNLGINPEFMTTSAAIRTFSVLNLEDRNVIAMLQLI